MVYGLQSFKYFLSDRLEKRFADPSPKPPFLLLWWFSLFHLFATLCSPGFLHHQAPYHTVTEFYQEKRNIPCIKKGFH